MGIMSKMFGGKKGVQCSRNPDGSDTCVRFQLDDSGNKISTGSEITIGVDGATCKATIGGDVNSLMDDEINDFEHMARAKEQACKRGVQ